MRSAILAGVFVYAALFFFTTFVSSAEAERQAAGAGFSVEEIQRGLEYAYQRRLMYWLYVGVDFLLLLLLACTPLARKLTDAVHAKTGGQWFVTLLAVTVLCLGLQYLLGFPFACVRLEHQRAWGLTTRPFVEWLEDWFIAVGVSILIWTGVLVGLFVLIRWFPRWWPVMGTAATLVCGALYIYAQPLVIAPLFNTFTPLRETKWAALEYRVHRLTDKAGIVVSEVLVVDASRQGSHTNAYFTGFGTSRRIVLYDTLLEKYKGKDDQVESVLAHEIGHWRHDHIVKGVALAVPGTLLALWLLSLILRRAVGRKPWYLERPSDAAAVPLVLLLYTAGMWVAAPVQNAVSRYFERQADMAALELTENPDAFERIERGLANDNIANVAPAPWNVWLFSTHPTTVEAIEMARQWRAQHPKTRGIGVSD